MNTSHTSIPFYLKFTITFVGLMAFGAFLYWAQGLLKPLVFALIFAILLTPVVDAFQRLKVPRIIAITITVLFGCVLIGGIIYFLLMEISIFQESLPAFQQKLSIALREMKQWFSREFHMSMQSIDSYVETLQSSTASDPGSAIGSTLAATIAILFVWLLVPVYVFLVLYYQPLIYAFIQEVTARRNLAKVAETIAEISKMVQSYLKALLFEAVIMAVLNSVALLVIGVDYAIMLGVTGAILNIIPYIGGIASIAIPMFVAFVTEGSLSSPLYVLLVLSIVQFIDNHVIVPFVVASRVQINSLFGLIVVLAFGEMFGVAGMFIAIILTAIAKIIFDRIDRLKPYGMLLGTDIPDASRFMKKIEGEGKS